MSTLAIEINDAGLVIADESGPVGGEPGFAYVDKSGVVTGRAAAEQARLKPDRVSSRFWAELAPDSPADARIGATPAELACAQLESVWRPFASRADAAVLVVPGGYTKEQLGLLLGLAEECRIPVRAIVDAAVAASTRPYPDRQLVYADAGLHRVSVTPLEQGDDAVKAEAERGLEAGGLSAYMDMIAKRAGELFVGATRFDPFHDAATEQQLYDRLSDWLAALRTEEALELSLQYAGEQFTVDVERDQLLGAVSGFYRALVQLIASARAPGQALVVQLTDRLARLPGLERELARLDAATVVRLPDGFGARASLELVERIESGGDVKWLRRAAWREPPVAADAAPPPASAAGLEAERDAAAIAPTHLVYRGIAYPVGAEGLVIGRTKANGRRTIVVDDQSGVSRSHCRVRLGDGEMRLEDLSSYGTYVNERRVSGEETLHPADVIRIGSPGAQLHVVSVESGHAA